jgi:hypothetical protein
LWGGFGIAATLAAGWILFGQRLNNKGWVGLLLLLAGMIMINCLMSAACICGQRNSTCITLRKEEL